MPCCQLCSAAASILQRCRVASKTTNKSLVWPSFQLRYLFSILFKFPNFFVLRFLQPSRMQECVVLYCRFLSSTRERGGKVRERRNGGVSIFRCARRAFSHSSAPSLVENKHGVITQPSKNRLPLVLLWCTRLAYFVLIFVRYGFSIIIIDMCNVCVDMAKFWTMKRM